jgi:hypothetical protein
MTDQLELNRVLGAFLATGTDELADRVLDAALDQIDHTPQRHALRVPWRFQTMTLSTRLAAAAVIGVIAIGGAFYLLNGKAPAVGNTNPSPSLSATATTPPLPSWIPSDRPHPPGPMGTGRQIQAASRLADGRVLVTGGFDYYDQPLASAVLYDPVARTFTATGQMSAARGYQTSTTLQDGRVLIAGGGRVSWSGNDTSPFLASAELFDPATGTFKATGSMSVAREDHTATLLSDGRVLIVGGDDVPDHALATAELFDPKTGTFSATGSMSSPRGFHTATLLDDGRVLITGGTTGNWDTSTALASAELFDPKTGTFSRTGAMIHFRAWHTATRLLDGRVLLTGGTTSTNQVEAELFDPKTGTFAATGSMLTGRLYHTATLLQDGRVLVVGGGGDYTNLKFVAAAELYDPATGTFSATRPMTDARTYHTATLLTDGRVFVAGGYGSTAPLANGEIWDPATGTFSPAS